MEAQNKRILKHLKKGLSITPLSALRLFGCMRLAARIYELRQAGHDIEGVRFKYKGSRPIRYSLKGEKQ